jgi:UDPglucose 6-dehydrogenase
MNITVMGLGFVGLTTALGLAEKGHHVQGYDIEEQRSNSIADGEIPFLEPGLDEALNRHLGRRFTVAKQALDAVKDSDAVFFCVGTPSREDGRADLRPLYEALDALTPTLQDGRFRVLVIKSTVPPGTTQLEVIPHIHAKGLLTGRDVGVANNPEFLREGKCWGDFMQPDRIVCGVADERSQSVLYELYQPFGAPVHFVSLNTGEFIKYLSNTLLATLISYSNEMSCIADAIGGIETGRAFRILHEDKRWSGADITSYFYPGCGYGGYCLPKDTQGLAAQAKLFGYEPEILKNVITTNDHMPRFMVERIKRAAASKEARIGILGLSFKPGSDDVRESSAGKIIRLLLKDGYRNISAYDPQANDAFSRHYGFDIRYCASARQLCDDSDAIVLVTAWPEFKSLQGQYAQKEWVDCRYFLNT